MRSTFMLRPLAVLGVLLASSFSVAVNPVVQASDGTLDTQFGYNGNGYVELDRNFDVAGTSYEFENTIAVPAGDDFLFVGRAREISGDSATGPYRLAMVKLVDSGDLSVQFGGGFRLIDLPIGSDTADTYLDEVFVDSSNGSIFVIGRYGLVDTKFKHSFVAKFSSTGELVTNWGSASPQDGLSRLTNASGAQCGSAVGAFGSDKVVVLEQDCSSNQKTWQIQAFSLATGLPVALGSRSDGSVFSLPNLESQTYTGSSVADLAFNGDKLIVARVDYDYSGQSPVEYLGLAAVDLSGAGTPALTDISPSAVETSSESISRFKPSGDGGFYIAATLRDDNADSPVHIVRLTSSGALDSSFGTNGVLQTEALLDTWFGLGFVVDSGKFVFEGRQYDSSPEVFADTFVARVNSDGTLDSTFGSGGYARVNLSCTVDADSGELAMSAAGKYVLGGTRYNGELRVLALGTGGKSAGECSSAQPGSGGGGSGGGGDYTPPSILDPAPIWTVGQRDGKLLVCVDINGSEADHIMASVRDSAFDWTEIDPNVDPYPANYLRVWDMTLQFANEAFDLSSQVEWDGGDIEFLFDTYNLVKMGGAPDFDQEPYSSSAFEVGKTYLISPNAQQYGSSYADSAVAVYPAQNNDAYEAARLSYTFASADVACGDTPSTGTGSSSGSGSSGSPSLVTSANQELLTASLGSAKIVINGELVDVDLVQAPESLRRSYGPARTFAEVQALQALADQMIAAVQEVLGTDATLPISVTKTDTGATISGLVTDPVSGESLAVPVEDVLLMLNESLAIMVGGADGEGDPANIAFDGVLEFGEGGYVAVLAYGLTPGAAGEIVVMSTPELIDTFAVDADGGVLTQAQIPSDLAAGEHTVVVAVDGQSASLGFRVLPQGTLPVTGSDSSTTALLIVLVAVGSLIALSASRRRQHQV